MEYILLKEKKTIEEYITDALFYEEYLTLEPLKEEEIIEGSKNALLKLKGRETEYANIAFAIYKIVDSLISKDYNRVYKRDALITEHQEFRETGVFNGHRNHDNTYLGFAFEPNLQVYLSDNRIFVERKGIYFYSSVLALTYYSTRSENHLVNIYQFKIGDWIKDIVNHYTKYDHRRAIFDEDKKQQTNITRMKLLETTNLARMRQIQEVK